MLDGGGTDVLGAADSDALPFDFIREQPRPPLSTSPPDSSVLSSADNQH